MYKYEQTKACTRARVCVVYTSVLMYHVQIISYDVPGTPFLFFMYVHHPSGATNRQTFRKVELAKIPPDLLEAGGAVVAGVACAVRRASSGIAQQHQHHPFHDTTIILIVHGYIHTAVPFDSSTKVQSRSDPGVKYIIMS